MRGAAYRLTHHIRNGLTPSPFRTLLPLVTMSYMPEPLGDVSVILGLKRILK